MACGTFSGRELMRSVAEHLDAILSNAQASRSLEVNLLGSVGCVLAQDVTVEDDDGSLEILLGKGTIIAARHIALISAAGLSRVWVHPQPRVVVLTVGDELGEPGEEGKKPDINGLALTAAATAAGAMTFRVGPLPSNPELVASAIEDQLVRSDILIAACGMSAPDYQMLTGVLRDLGNLDFVRIAMQPGSAQGFGSIGPDATPVFVVPGNPVGALLSFDIFIRPLIRRLMGNITLHHRTIEATLESDVSSNENETTYIRAQLSTRKGELSVKSLEGAHTHPLEGLGTADAIIVVAPGTQNLAKGSRATVIRLDNDGDV